MDRSLFTANFKRDYVAASAVIIFFMIVAAELALAISIPAYFVKSDLWALNIKRQELFKKFDGIRNACGNASPGSHEAQEENKLVYWSLNLMANYLRTGKHDLSAGETDMLMDELREIEIISGRIRSNNYFNRRQTLDFSTADRIMADRAAKAAIRK